MAGHKLYAPKGVGALYRKSGIPSGPVLVGANHEGGLRPGTENVASIVGLGAAAALAWRDLSKLPKRLESQRDRLLESLRAAVPRIEVNGGGAERLPNTLSVRFPRAAGSAVLALAPELYASTGSACHDGHDRASSSITAMGVSESAALGTVRLTLGRSTTDDEIDRAAAALARAWRVVSARG